MALLTNQTRTAKTTDSWITPRELIDALGPFDLDPCECDTQPWPCAKRSYRIADDGLSQPWKGFVWCNPPYGAAIGQWLKRMAEHNNGIALLFARTDTRAFRDHVFPHASCLLFLSGRLHFHYPNGDRAAGNCGGPLVLIAYGERAAKRLASNRRLGCLLAPSQ